MFNITPVNSLPPNVNLLLKGTQLAFWDIPQVFALTSQDVKDVFLISITFCKSDSFKEPKLDLGTIIGNRLDIKLINPHDSIPTSNKTRVTLLISKEQNIQLSYSMFILSPRDCAHMLFYYEFYEEPIFEEPLQGTIQTEQSEAHP